MDYTKQIEIMQAKQDGKSIDFRKVSHKDDGTRKNGWVRGVDFKEFDFSKFEYRIGANFAVAQPVEVDLNPDGSVPTYASYKIDVGNHSEQVVVYGSRELQRKITNFINDIPFSERDRLQAEPHDLLATA